MARLHSLYVNRAGTYWDVIRFCWFLTGKEGFGRILVSCEQISHCCWLRKFRNTKVPLTILIDVGGKSSKCKRKISEREFSVNTKFALSFCGEGSSCFSYIPLCALNLLSETFLWNRKWGRERCQLPLRIKFVTSLFLWVPHTCS